MSWLVEPTCPARAYVASASSLPLPMAKHPLRQMPPTALIILFVMRPGRNTEAGAEPLHRCL